jgi:hypothetical protein
MQRDSESRIAQNTASGIAADMSARIGMRE